MIGVARWLSLAAAPVFAAMATATAIQEWQAGVVLCGALPASPLGGMAIMYALMAGLHLGPWLRLASARRRSSP